MRPRLHRYCSRMTGSTIDGEDVVQEALIKAYNARASFAAIDNPEGWLLRIAHNAALDLLRRRAREPIMTTAEELDLLAALDTPDADIATAPLRRFMRLPPLQRSAVILRDVLGHTLDEAASIADVTEAAAKSALQRGRATRWKVSRRKSSQRPPGRRTNRRNDATTVAIVASSSGVY